MSTEKCYKSNKDVRKEVRLLLLLIIIMAPLIFGVYVSIKPKIERVYNIQIDGQFAITPFSVKAVNITGNNYINMDIDPETDNYYIIESVELGFNLFNAKIAAKEYENAMVYQESNDDSLNRKIKYGDYIVRSFDTSAIEIGQIPEKIFMFKMPPEYSLFYVMLKISGTSLNRTFITNFYKFYATEETFNEDVFQRNIIIQQTEYDDAVFNTVNYENELLYPYSLGVSIINLYRSPYVIDFSFR